MNRDVRETLRIATGYVHEPPGAATGVVIGVLLSLPVWVVAFLVWRWMS